MEQIRQQRKLYRSRIDRYLGGVCGGIAEYFEIDGSMVRLLFVLGTLLWGAGVVVYLAALILVPENPDLLSEKETPAVSSPLFWGILFVLAGAILLSWQLDFFNLFDVLHLPWTTLWALFLIAMGAAMLLTQWRHEQPAGEDSTEPGARKKTVFDMNITRSRTDRKIAGVCGGLARHFDIDSSLVRLIWILLTIASKGLGILIYIIFMFVFPEESPQQTT